MSVVLRLACPQDLRARQALARRGPSANTFQAILHFLFQEATLEAVVLLGAGLFIWFGVSLNKLLLLPPLAGAVVAIAVVMQHQALGEKHAQDVGGECWGVVAEYRGPLLAPDAAPPPTVVALKLDCQPDPHTYSQIIGTLSVSYVSDVPGHCRLHAFTVHPTWRRKGVGRGLAGAARGAAERRGGRGGALFAVVSELQPAARTLLHNLGWSASGWWSRRIAGGVYTLQLLQLRLELPYV